MSPQLLVVQNQDRYPPALLGDWITAAGVEYELLKPYDRGVVPETLDGYSGLMVLGGSMNAMADGQYPWLAQTRRLIKRATDAGRAVLGIGLGHQMSAAALGGRVESNPNGYLVGVAGVRRTTAAEDDPLLSHLPLDAVAVQWSTDTVTAMPANAQVLSRSDGGTVQSARFGALSWGLQLHPEATPELVDQWIVDAHEIAEISPVDLKRLAGDTRAFRRQLEAIWQPLAARFAELVRTAPAS